MAAPLAGLVDYAEAYSRLGWALTPVHGKMAIVQGWQNTEPIDPDSAVDVWRARVEAAPHVNIGLVLGPSGVIDYEMDAGTEEDFLSPFGGVIPDTPAYRSGSGKLHILFDAGEGRAWTRFQKNGFEIRAGAHQSVLPPSKHPSGGIYEWVPGHEPWTLPLALPPAALFEGMEREDDTGGVHWLEVLASKEKLGEGQGRHASLISYLGRMVETLDSEEQLIAAGLTYAALTQDPPYPDDSVRAQARDVWRRYREDSTVPEGFDTVKEAAEALNIRRLDTVSMRSIHFLWRPFIQRSAFHLLVGQKGAGKGSLLSYFAAQMTRGRLEDNEARSVMWCRTEDSFEIDVKPRFTAQGGDPTKFYAVHKHIVLPADLAAMETFARQADVGMIVIDPIGSVMPAKSSANDETDVLAAIGALNDLADELDLVIFGVRHLGKALDRGALSAVLGNVAWVNTPRAVLGIAKDDDDLVVLEVMAGNRVRGHDAYEFFLDDVPIEGLSENVTKIIPQGVSTRNIDDLLKDKSGTKLHMIKEKIRDMLDASIDGLVMPKTEWPLDDWKCSYNFASRAARLLVDEGYCTWITPPRAKSGEYMKGHHYQLKKL